MGGGGGAKRQKPENVQVHVHANKTREIREWVRQTDKQRRRDWETETV